MEVGYGKKGKTKEEGRKVKGRGILGFLHLFFLKMGGEQRKSLGACGLAYIRPIGPTQVRLLFISKWMKE